MIAFLNRLKLRKKLYLLFIVGVLFPMVLTDAVIFMNVRSAARAEMLNMQKNIADTVDYTLQNRLSYPMAVAENIYKSTVLESFLNESYASGAKYFSAYYKLHSDLIFGGTMGIEDAKIYLFADNATILNGSGFYRMDKAWGTEWYQLLKKSGKDRLLLFYYGTIEGSEKIPRRKILMMIRKDGNSGWSRDKLYMIELGYAAFEKDLLSLGLDSEVYVCDGNKILLSNREDYRIQDPYVVEKIKGKDIYSRPIHLYGRDLTIYVVPRSMMLLRYVRKNGTVVIALVVLNLLLPVIMLRLIEKSVTVRVEGLQKSFENPDSQELEVIERVEGNDEISDLIRSYNRMAARMNGLIQDVYKARLREQEINLSRQNAELLALQSQINPHFLFNTLESIRMHSLIRNETETAEMVGRLAVMERTFVNWGEDLIPVQKEMDFVEAYLQLQKYRFEDRLNYSFSVDADCRRFAIPKLTIVTFVENACVHGVEKKATPGWIFVRVYKEEGWLQIEVEDSGTGMEEDELKEIQDRVENVTIDEMKDKKHVGMMNAFLRVSLLTKGRARFEMESEKGLGTTVRISFPLGMM
ncbi:MAG: histidine kinase [Lachnospiraceae bacterium]|nr:histidine kinase [Lachnospiraceae bacterium]